MAGSNQDLWLAVALGGLPFIANAVGFAFGYLCGAIPFGYLLAKFGGVGDIRAIGSGNIGATNVLRTGKRGLALATLLLDAAKGFLPVFLAQGYLGAEAALWAAAGAFAGHLFPVWLHFRGGKGVATFIGILAAVSWPVALFFCVVWLAVAAASRYSSLAALVAASLAPGFSALIQGSWAVTTLIAALSAVMFVRHRRNIANLLAGHESKISFVRRQTSETRPSV